MERPTTPWTPLITDDDFNDDDDFEDEGNFSFDTISNCYSMPAVHAIGKNDEFLTGSEASMFLEFHTSSYQQFNAWNDDEDFPAHIAYLPKRDNKKSRFKKHSHKSKTDHYRGLNKNVTHLQKTDHESKQLDKSNSTLGSVSAKEFRSIDSSSAMFHDAQSAGSSCDRRIGIDQTYKVLFECQVKKVNKLENELHSQHETILQLKRSQDNELGENRNLSMRVIHLQKNLETLTQNLALSEQTPDESDILKEKDNKIQELSRKLTKEMSKKIASNESSLENVNIKNRPMNVATEYELICSNQWLHAKNTLDARCPKVEEGVKVEFLCAVFTIAEEEADKSLKQFKYKLKEDVDNPLKAPRRLSSNNPRPVDNWLPLPNEINNSIGDYLRNNADDTDLSQLIQSIKEQLRSRKHLDISTAYTFNLTFTKYLETCARLAWKMVLQRPALQFKIEGLNKEWNGLFDKQELYWGSSIPKERAATVRYYVHPMLYHGDQLMVKGRVMVN